MVNEVNSPFGKEEEVLRQIKLIFKTGKASAGREFSKIFYQYYQRYFQDNARLRGMFDESRHILNITGAKGKRALDLGCGFGLTAILLKAFGCKEVFGIDINKEKIEIFQKLLPKTFPCEKDIVPLIGDGLKIDFEDEFFDVIIVRETISHVRDLEFFLLEIKRVLRKNGVFYIKDDNNAFDVRGRMFRRRWWKKCEFGSMNGIGATNSYRAMREKMIKGKFPLLDPNVLKMLAVKTAGMWGEEIYETVEKFCKSGSFPKTKGFKYRNPETGEYPEFEFNPYRLKKLLAKMGFRAYVIRPFYSYTYSGVKGYFYKTIGCLVSLFHPISLLIAPTFEIVAYKSTFR